MLRLQRRGPRRRGRRPARLHRHGPRPVPRRARGDRRPCEKQGGHYVGERRLADHQVPVEVQDGAPRREPELLSARASRSCAPTCSASRRALTDGRPRLRLPAAGARRLRVRHRRLAVRRAQRRAPEFSESGRRSVYALAGILTVAFVVLEVAFLRNDFAFNTVADTSSRTTPAVLPGRRRVVLAGRLAAAVGLAAVAVVEPRAVPDAQAPARRRGLRDRDPARLRRLLHLADGLLREPVRDDHARRRRKARDSIRCCASRR